MDQFSAIPAVATPNPKLKPSEREMPFQRSHTNFHLIAIALAAPIFRSAIASLRSGRTVSGAIMGEAQIALRASRTYQAFLDPAGKALRCRAERAQLIKARFYGGRRSPNSCSAVSARSADSALSSRSRAQSRILADPRDDARRQERASSEKTRVRS